MSILRGEPLPSHQPVATSALEELTRLWHKAGGAELLIGQGTRLWHCGRIPSIQEMDDDRALWCTGNLAKSDDYAGWAKAPTRGVQHRATKLELEVRRDLRAADFAMQSLLMFTQNHCRAQHDLMKLTLRTWLSANGFDAAARTNRDEDEVVVVRPASDLVIATAVHL